MDSFLPIILYFANFAISLYGLMALDFSKFIYPRRTRQAQVLILLLAMALSYLITQFLLGLRLP